jgi:hypothetical protein
LWIIAGAGSVSKIMPTPHPLKPVFLTSFNNPQHQKKPHRRDAEHAEKTQERPQMNANKRKSGKKERGIWGYRGDKEIIKRAANKRR